ncbi:hypothetical protein [Streptomyces brasiliensis]|uniref:Uncharacterized protein n=1 Tax=Streptomyces brasiliensis TaxID=1954 RepID=A0A917NU71_9ACTN|nr:hypothetical protein [Streptomyces brasiliensis]GGJ28622.1 hypothetical protein GCM10010121_044950 [Streptomyces brasiliensis]
MAWAKQPEGMEEGQSGDVSEAGPALCFVLCFVLCLTIVAYGVHLIVAK